MKRSAILAWILAASTLLCMSACSGQTNPPATDTTAAPNTQQVITTENTSGTLPLPQTGNMIDTNFYGFEEKDFGDVRFSFETEGITKVLKQERSFFSENELPTVNGKKWDSAANAWVSVEDVTTTMRAYQIDFKEEFKEGSLTVKFQFKRNGGKQQAYGVQLKGTNRTQGAVVFGNETLRVGGNEMRIDSAKVKPVSIGADQWCDAYIVYTLNSGTLTISAVISDEYGEILASAVSDPIKFTSMNTSGLSLLDMSSENIADYGSDTPEHPTSVWYIKNLSIRANTMKTGDRVKLEYTTFESYPYEGQTVYSNYISINGEQTMRAYFGQYCLMQDGSGFVCGNPDGRFYFYDIEKQELVYLDMAYPHLNEMLYYVNPVTDNVFYRQVNEEGCEVLYRINPKTMEKTVMFEADSTDVWLGYEVTHDEKYTFYRKGPDQADAGGYVRFGRVNLETDEYEYECARTYANSRFNINHFIVNPVNPDLILFHREQNVGLNENDQTNVINIVTGEVITYEQPMACSVHMLWSYDGEYVIGTNYENTTHLIILTKELEEVHTQQGNFTSYIMVDGSLTWAFGDGGSGTMLHNIKTGETYRISRMPLLYTSGHPFHSHCEISRDGKTMIWGHVNEDGVLGIAWTTNPYIEE